MFDLLNVVTYYGYDFTLSFKGIFKYIWLMNDTMFGNYLKIDTILQLTVYLKEYFRDR